MNEAPRTSRPALSVFELASRLLHELPGMVSDRLELLSLELRRASKSLVTMIVLGLVAAILLLTAWFAAWIGIAGALVAVGLHWGWALAIVLAINIGGAVFALLRARALVTDLTLPATKRRLTLATVMGPDPSTPTPAPRHEHTLTPQVRTDGL